MSTGKRQLERGGRWLALSGLAFVVTFVTGLALLSRAPGITASAEQVMAFYSSPAGRNTVVAGAYLMPFAGTMFLWYTAVLRSREELAGAARSSFNATVATAGGTVFVSCLFVAAAGVAVLAVSTPLFGSSPQSFAIAQLQQELGYEILLVYGMRAVGTFVLFSSRLALASHSLPRWLAIPGIVLGVLLLIAITHNTAILLVLPLWVAVVSVYALLRPAPPGPEDAGSAGRRT